MTKRRHTQRVINNSLTELASNVKLWATLSGGNSLSNYGTISNDNNYALITLNWIVLSYMYAGNGIFQRAMRLPVLDALSKGFIIESSEASNEDVDVVMKWYRKENIYNNVKYLKIWSRLFGGSAIVINTNQDPQTPLNLESIGTTPIAFYTVDRWQLAMTSPRPISDFLVDELFRVDNNECYTILGKQIHKSRVLIDKGEEAPFYVARQLRGWGISEGERIIRDLNLYLKTQDVLYEILDESKIDIYYIQGLANKLATTGGTAAIQTRIQTANELKNYLNALILDANDKFEQKQVGFAGLAEVMTQNRMGIAAAINFPMTKLFGMSSAGFNSGEDDLENYNSMVESEVRMPLAMNVLPTILDMGFQICHGYIPQYDIKWPPLRVLTAEQEENIKTSKSGRILMFFDRGLVNAPKAMEWAEKEDLIPIDVGYVPEKVQPNNPDGIDQISPEQRVKTINVKRNNKPQIKKTLFNRGK
jgi:phage-related protein (TIGR01555 family)